MSSAPASSPANAAAYQHLLSSALQTRNANAALAIIPAILNDPTVGDAGVKLLGLAFSIAATVREPGLLSRTRLPRRSCVLVYQPWFGFDFTRMVRTGLEREILLPVFAGMRGSKSHLPGLTPANFRHYDYKDVNLWSICHYNLALTERSMPEDLSGENPKSFAAIQKLYAHAAGLIDEAIDFIETYRPESVIIAQGYHLVAAVMRRIAIRHGVRVVSLENTFHRGKLLWEDASGVAVNLTLAKNYFWRYADSVSEQQARQSVDRYLGSIQSFKSSEHTSPAASTAALPGTEKPLIVYLGQVATDASVLFGRRQFATQVDAIRAVTEYALERDVAVVVKLHPKEGPLHKVPEPYYRGLTSGWLAADAAFQRCRLRLGDRLVVDADNSFNTYDLIRRADVCVTINSQSGLEALLHDREVILCGDAAFGGLGFTHEVHDTVALHATLHRVLGEGLRHNDGIRCRKFFHIFTDYYCLPKTEESMLMLAAGRPAYPRVVADAADASLPLSPPAPGVIAAA